MDGASTKFLAVPYKTMRRLRANFPAAATVRHLGKVAQHCPSFLLVDGCYALPKKVTDFEFKVFCSQ